MLCKLYFSKFVTQKMAKKVWYKFSKANEPFRKGKILFICCPFIIRSSAKYKRVERLLICCLDVFRKRCGNCQKPAACWPWQEHHWPHQVHVEVHSLHWLYSWCLSTPEYSVYRHYISLQKDVSLFWWIPYLKK